MAPRCRLPKYFRPDQGTHYDQAAGEYRKRPTYLFALGLEEETERLGSQSDTYSLAQKAAQDYVPAMEEAGSLAIRGADHVHGCREHRVRHERCTLEMREGFLHTGGEKAEPGWPVLAQPE